MRRGVSCQLLLDHRLGGGIAAGTKFAGGFPSAIALCLLAFLYYFFIYFLSFFLVSGGFS